MRTRCPPHRVAAVVEALRLRNRTLRSTAASVGLITASAVLTHLSGGHIEAHFHFFIMLAVIALYQTWVPFLTSICYVLLHHGIAGTLNPSSVYNHPDAVAHPWKWGIARGLGKQTIAEFVGDKETVKLLREYGVDFAQGYHVGKPLPLTSYFGEKRVAA